MITIEDMNIAMQDVVIAKKRNDEAREEMINANKAVNDATERLDCCTRLRQLQPEIKENKYYLYKYTRYGVTFYF